jgi:hypothetical protein
MVTCEFRSLRRILYRYSVLYLVVHNEENRRQQYWLIQNDCGQVWQLQRDQQ